MPRRLVGIMAKAPVAGQVKTRLIPALGADGAARLQRYMLLDTIELTMAALDGDGSISIVCPTAADRETLQRFVPAEIGIVAHVRGDIMCELDYVLTSHLAQG